MRMSLSVKNQSIETSGLPKDYREVLCEYIWNGYEANATEVSLSFKLNATGEGVESITIADNGDGINYNTLSETFGSFLVSQKNSLALKEKSKANKGKGRFSFGLFASLAEWDTCYCEEGKYKKYKIRLANSNKQELNYDDLPQDSVDEKTGTTVSFYNIDGVSKAHLEFLALEEFLLGEFAWFLYLHKDDGHKLLVNGVELCYQKHINDTLSKEIEHTINGKNFKINLVVWRNKIKEKFCCYFMTEQGALCGVDTTTFNRNTVDFNHSVFVASSAFDKFTGISFVENSQLEIGKPAEYYDIIRELKGVVQKLISQQLSLYMAGKAEAEVQKMINERKTFPVFPDDEYGQLRKNDLVRVTKEIYCTEPKIFYKLSDLQEKSLLAFLNLLLSSEEREAILSVIEQIVELSPEQRRRFSGLLQKTRLAYIIDAIEFIENRYQVIEILKSLIFDLHKFTTERDHIQKIIEQHFWLFGEQYHLASADVQMNQALAGYLNILYGASTPAGTLLPDEEENRRMDIFLCNSRKVENSYGDFLEENIVLELKAPKVPLSIKVIRQIEDYMRFIRRQPQFSSIRRRWKFIAVCKEVDDDVKDLYKAFEDKGKPGLVHIVDDFEVYALCWDDVFKSFELRHSFILDKLKFDKTELAKELAAQDKNRATVDALTEQVLAM